MLGRSSTVVKLSSIRYLTKEDGEWVCNQQFKDYSLINQLVKR